MATAPFQQSCDMPANAQTVFELLTNEEFLRQKYAGEKGEFNVSVEKTADAATVVIEREIIIENPPAIAKPFIKDKMMLRLTQEWQKSGDNYTASADYRLLDTPAFIDGDLHIKANGETSSLAADFNAHVNIAFVGSKASKVLAEAATKRLLKDFEQNKKGLA